jgi:glutamine amidotransferase
MIAIIDYEAGNLTSVQRALTHLGKPSVITSDLSQVMQAERIIFPGVGAAGKAMEGLKKRELHQGLLMSYQQGKPILGICLGTQIVMDWSEENNTSCLGLIKGKVLRFLKTGWERGRKCLIWDGTRFNCEGKHSLFDGSHRKVNSISSCLLSRQRAPLVFWETFGIFPQSLYSKIWCCPFHL